MPELVFDFRHRANLFYLYFKRYRWEPVLALSVTLRLPLKASLGVIYNSRALLYARK